MKRILALCSLVLLPACGSDTSGIDSFIEDIATQQCSWEFRCCTDAEIKTQDGTKFTTEDACVPYHKLALQDIAGSRAHVAMLAQAGIVTQEDAAAIHRRISLCRRREALLLNA